MNTRAKFACVEIVEHGSLTGQDSGYTIKLKPVSSGSDENRDFYKWTPSGEITLGVIRGGAASQFKVGFEYYVDFTEVS